MSLTEKIAVKIGSNAKLFLDADEDTVQIIIYGAINLFQTIFAILWVIIASLCFGVLFEGLLFSITAGVFRKYSGGAHASSPSRCIIIGTVLAVLSGIVIDKVFYRFNIVTVILISMASIIFALIIVLKNAPVDSIKKPITNLEMKKQLKKKSVIIVSVFSFLIIILFVLNIIYSQLCYIRVLESIVLGMLWQTITLTKGGISLLNKGDFVLKYISERS